MRSAASPACAASCLLQEHKEGVLERDSLSGLERSDRVYAFSSEPRLRGELPVTGASGGRARTRLLKRFGAKRQSLCVQQRARLARRAACYRSIRRACSNETP